MPGPPGLRRPEPEELIYHTEFLGLASREPRFEDIQRCWRPTPPGKERLAMS